MIRQTATHSADHEDDAALYALGMLEGEELSLFEHHLAACERCRRIVEEDRRAIDELSAASPEMDPSPGLRSRTLGRAAVELSRRPPRPSDTRERPSPVLSRGTLGRAFPLVALVALAVGLGFIIGQLVSERQVLVSAPLYGDVGSGSAVVAVHRSGVAELDLRGLADPPDGHVYEAWIVGADRVPRRAGVYSEGDGSFMLDGAAIGTTVFITLELAPGSDAPTTKPILSGGVTQ